MKSPFLQQLFASAKKNIKTKASACQLLCHDPLEYLHTSKLGTKSVKYRQLKEAAQKPFDYKITPTISLINQHPLSIVKSNQKLFQAIASVIIVKPRGAGTPQLFKCLCNQLPRQSIEISPRKFILAARFFLPYVAFCAPTVHFSFHLSRIPVAGQNNPHGAFHFHYKNCYYFRRWSQRETFSFSSSRTADGCKRTFRWLPTLARLDWRLIDGKVE